MSRVAAREVAQRSSPALLLALFVAGHSACASDVDWRESSFQSGQYELKAVLSSPAERTPLAGVLIIPGSGPVDRDGLSRVAPTMPPVYRKWAERLSETGFVVLRYEKRFLTHPDLDIASFDQEAQITDALSALASLRSQPELAGRRIFIVGHSEGGTLAPLVAERSGDVAGIAIVNAVQFPIDELLLAQLQARRGVPSSTVEDVRRSLGEIREGSFPKGGLLLGAGASYWAQWMAFTRQAPQTLSRVAMPILLVQCLDDETLPGDTLARNVAILRDVASTRRNARLRELRDHDHFGMMSGERQPSSEFISTLIDWLRHETSDTPTPTAPGTAPAPSPPASPGPPATRPRAPRPPAAPAS
jgi:pimeloyl-ACP methyl ester carboxylesterase